MLVLKFIFFFILLNILIVLLSRLFKEAGGPVRRDSSGPLSAYHERLGYAFIKNARVRGFHERGQYSINTNSDGIRSDKEYSLKKSDPGVFRILVFGDSFTAADSVSNPERFTDLLEKMMRGVEIINFAVSGYGTDQQLLAFEENGLKYDFDLVLVCPLIENIRRNVSQYRLAIDRESGKRILTPKPFFILKDGQLILQNTPVPQERIELERASKEMLSKTDFGGLRSTFLARSLLNEYFAWLKPALISLLRWRSHPEYYDPLSYEWLLMSAILRRFKESGGNKPVVIAPLPYYVQIEGRENASIYKERFNSLDNGSDIRVLDIFEGFRKLDKKQKRECRWRHDIHYTPFAHKIAAESLYSGLKSLGLISAEHFISMENNI